MCLLVIAWRAHPRYRLIVAANRDEFHERPAAPMSKWPPPGEILAGRDLRANGTWLGVDRQRRFGVVTNFRDMQPPSPEAPSRGQLIPQYLEGQQDAGAYLQTLEASAAEYSGFNLLLTDRESLWYGCNRGDIFARALSPGVYGLSNQFLDTPWPKLRTVRQRFESWLETQSAPGNCAESLFGILNDRRTVADHEDLPQTGLSPEWERILSSPFVLNRDYGTRCSTVLLLEPSGGLFVAERRFDPRGVCIGHNQWELNGGEWL